MSMNNDKRRRERSAIDQEIELSTSEGQLVKARGINMSEGGLLCRSDEAIPQGTFVRFNLSLPSGEKSISVECEGCVLRCVAIDGKYDVVIDFTD